MIPAAMRRLRAHPPTTLLGAALTESTDLLPRTDGLRWRTDRVRVVVRPSGTEPKLKCYLQVRAPVGEGANLGELRADAAAELARLRDEVAAIIGL
jgi:phosphomannomutase